MAATNRKKWSRHAIASIALCWLASTSASGQTIGGDADYSPAVRERASSTDTGGWAPTRTLARWRQAPASRADAPLEAIANESSANAPNTMYAGHETGAALAEATYGSTTALPDTSELRVMAPNMIGDFIGVAYYGPPPPSDNNAFRFPEDTATVRGIARFKAADNRSPRPQSRLWFSFNRFDNAYESPVNINRYTIGAELAFFRNFSFEIFGPINDFENGIPYQDDVRYGDLRLLIKGVALENTEALLSWGCALSVPTAKRPAGVPGGVAYFSPFVGYLWAPVNSRWFVQGFFQIDINIDDDDQGLLHTDAGVGYWILRRTGGDSFLTGIAPTVEMHLYNPVFGAPTGEFRGLIYNDVLNLTVGSTFYMLRDRLTFAAGVGFPISSSQDYDIEAIAHVNWMF